MAAAVPVRALVALVLGYWLMAMGSLWLSRLPGSVATLWFANAFGIAFLAVSPRGLWAWMLMLIGGAVFAANFMQGDEPGRALLFVVPNMLEVWLGALLLRRGRAVEPMLTSPVAFGRLMVLGVLLPPLMGASVAALMIGGADLARAEQTWLSWYVGGAVGGIALLPLCLSLLRARRQFDWRALTRPDTLLMAGLVLGTTMLSLLRLPYPYVYVTGVLTYVAVQAGFDTVAALSLLAVATAGSLISLGLFVPPPMSDHWEVSLFYLPILVMVIPPLLLAVAIARKGRRSQRALARSKAHYQRLYLSAPVMMHSLAADGQIISVSNFWLDSLGYQRNQVLDRPFTDFLTPQSAAYANEVVLPNLRASGTCRGAELDMVRSDGAVMRVQMSGSAQRDEWGRVIGTLAALEDITEKRALEAALLAEHQRKVAQAEETAARMSHLAQHDPLTGLPNRLLFFDRLQQALRSPRGTSNQLALIFIDLDHFKEINDTHGHQMGDELLRAIARRLAEHIRASDTVCRIGGDEFVVMLPAMERVSAATEITEKLLTEVCRPYVLGEQTLNISFSAGMAIAPDDGDTPELLIRHADDAMYQAKRQGRNRVVAYRQD